MTTYEKSTIELICDQLEGLFEARTWKNLNSPTIYQGLTLWNPETNTLPLITIIPRQAKMDTNKYGEVDALQGIEITALIPLPVGDSALIGEAVTRELIETIFLSRIDGKWTTFPDQLSGIKLLDAGIVQYPSEINPQMVQAGITVEVSYQIELYPSKDSTALTRHAWEDQ
jgi:hypothetical protein